VNRPLLWSVDGRKPTVCCCFPRHNPPAHTHRVLLMPLPDGLVGSEGYVSGDVKSLLSKAWRTAIRYTRFSGSRLSSDGCGPSSYMVAKRRTVPADGAGVWCRPLTPEVSNTSQAQPPVPKSAMRPNGALERFFCPALSRPIHPCWQYQIQHRSYAGDRCLASLLKVILALQHKHPRDCESENLNPSIPWIDCLFYVPTQPVEWPSTVTERRGRAESMHSGLAA